MTMGGAGLGRGRGSIPDFTYRQIDFRFSELDWSPAGLMPARASAEGMSGGPSDRDPAMLAGASPCSRSRTSPPFSLREPQGKGHRYEEDGRATARAVACGSGTRRAWGGGTRRPVSDARRVSATSRRTRATDHRCDCGYQISTSPPFPRCPMCGGHSWRLIAVTRQVLVRARKPHRAGAR